MGKQMCISFKNTDEDNMIFDVINSKRDKSSFIKDAILFYIEHMEDKKLEVIKKETNCIYRN